MAGMEDPHEDDTAFIKFEGMPVLSRSALQLHSFGIISGIKAVHPGFVSDDYLKRHCSEDHHDRS